MNTNRLKLKAVALGIPFWLVPLVSFAADPIAIGPPERKSLARSVEQPGRVEPFAQTPIHAKIGGYVKAVQVDIGDRVRAGQLLAELDVPEMDEDLKQKQALVVQSSAEIVLAEKLLAAAEAQVNSASATVAEAMAARKRALANYDRWKSEAARVAALVERRVIDEQTRDETNNQYRAAEAAREEVEARVRSAEAAKIESEARRDKSSADIAVARAKAGVAAADERRIKTLLNYARIAAPFNGVITARQLDVGHLLHPGKDAPLFVVTARDPIRVVVEVPEHDAAAIADGDAATVRVQGIRSLEVKGKVSRSAWALDAKSRTLRTAIDLPNPDGTLRPGMYCSAIITVTPKPVWTLPAAAAIKTADGWAAFTIRDGKATRVAVQLGAGTPTHVELLKWQSPSGWLEPNGAERFVLNAGGVVEGRAIRTAEAPPAAPR